MIQLIAAIDKNGVIGKDGKIPWHLPEDMRRFRETTENNIVVMGRKTYESLPKKPLPDRINIVMTTDINYEAAPGVLIMHSLEEVLQWYLGMEGTQNKSLFYSLYVIGGESIYKMFLPYANIVMLTTVFTEVTGGDAKFPTLPPQWEVLNSEDGTECEEAGLRYKFVTYIR